MGPLFTPSPSIIHHPSQFFVMREKATKDTKQQQTANSKNSKKAIRAMPKTEDAAESGGPGGGKRSNKDLSVEEKKQLLMEWFQDDERRSVGEFCVEAKGVPRARPFLRRAARELDLVSLRKVRGERGDADQVALSRIENFCPNAGRRVEKGADGKGDKGDAKLDVEEKKKLLLEWFVDEERRNIGKFCVEVKGVPRARPFLRRAAEELDLVSLRKARKERADADEVARSRILEYRPNEDRRETGAKDKDGGNGNGGRDLSLEQKRQLLLEWFTDGKQRNGRKFCVDKGAPQALPFVRRAAKELDLVSLREASKKEGNSDEEAKAMILDYVPKANLRGNHHEGKAKEKVGTEVSKLSMEQKKQFLLEWFCDDEERDIGEFCVDVEGAPRPFLRRAANELDLVSLREASKKEGESDEAAKAMILEYVPKANRREGNAKDKVGAKVSKLTMEQKKQFVLEWFCDDEERNIGKFCVDVEGAPRPFLRRAAEDLDLVSLRKVRKQQADTDDVAKARILEYRPNAHRRNRDGAGGDELSVDQKKQLLLEWFRDDEARNIGKFCVDKGMPRARPFLRRAAKDLDLVTLREAREGQSDADEVAEARILEYHPNAHDREKHGRAKGVGGSRFDQLSLEEKKKLILEWFRDDEARNIGKFCDDVKGMPRARPFLRRAAKDLDLVTLREAREGQSDADKVAEARILEYRPDARGHEKHGRAKGVGGSRFDQLSLEEKKKLLLEWFRDDEERNIGRFCVDAKGLPRARPFLKRAAEELDLVSLRKVRKERDDADDVAESRILEYRPNAKRARMADGSKRGDGDGKQKLDVEQKKQLLMEWFVDPEERNIRKFCVEAKDAPQACQFLKRAAEKLDLVGLRKLRKEQNNADEVAASRIASFHPNAKCHESLMNNEGSRAELKAALQGWFDDEENKPMRQFLEERGEDGLRPCAAKLVTENGLRKLRRQRDNPNVHQLALKKIDDIFSSDPAEEEPAKHQEAKAAQSPASDAADPEQHTSNEEIKVLLEEWFKDENMRPVRRFLALRNSSEAQAPMMHLVKENGLHKLRKRRDEDDVQQVAMDIIARLSVGDCADTETAQKQGSSGKQRVPGKQSKVVAKRLEAEGEDSAVRQLAAEDSGVSPGTKRDTPSTAAGWLFVKK